VLAFLVSEALRDVRRAGRVGVSAVLLMTLSLAALGAFWLLSLNLGRAVAQWRERVRVIAYLKDEPADVNAVLKKVEGLDGVQRVRYVSRADALVALRQSLGPKAAVVDDLPRNPLPASLEVTPDESAATPEGTRALGQRLSALSEVDEVQGGAEWVEGVSQWQRLLQMFGLGVGAVLALAAILTVTTATTLVLHVRRDEMEVMRLVGASTAVIRLTVLLQGLLQGLAGAVLALAGLEIAYALLATRIEPLLAVTLGLARAVFLSPPQILALLAGGAALGALGGLLANARGA
jgi:cell division transport system permease protein